MIIVRAYYYKTDMKTDLRFYKKNLSIRYESG